MGGAGDTGVEVRGLEAVVRDWERKDSRSTTAQVLRDKERI